jgi:membrane-associated protein
MGLLQQFVDIVLHLDTHLASLAAQLGPWLYVVLFAIIFCETGLVITPLLPGDSLLFAAGALAALDEAGISLPLLLVMLTAAAVAGDAVNYFVGFLVGPAVFASERSRLFNRKHLLRTHEFYERYGGMTIIIARFIPIIRTFAPFVAGIARMQYRRFSLYNITGGVAWVVAFLVGGYLFGNIKFVKDHFSFVTLAIIVISVMPAVIEFILAWRRARVAEAVPVESEY